MIRFGRNSKLNIRRRTQPQWLVQLFVLLPLFRAMLTQYLRLPSAIDYGLDLVWLALLVYLLCSPGAFKRKSTLCFLIWILLFFAYTLAGHLLRLQSPLYYLWGFRNNFRFYIAFLAFCAFLDSRDGENYLTFMDALFWLNLVMTLVQYVRGFRFDFLGGIFGTTIGCNSYSNIFMMIVVTKSLVYCFNKKESLTLCLAKCFTALLVAALAELKFFFAEFLVIAAMVFCMTRFSVRKVLVILAAGVGVLVGIAILTQLYPHFADAFLPRNFIEIATSKKGYTMEGDFNRLTAISGVNEQFLHTPLERLFGLGLGNCDTSSFSFLETPFATAHADRTHYNWFSTSFIYVETGWIGLALFFGFYGAIFWLAHRQQKLGGNLLYCQITKVMALCSVLLGIYNSSLRTEAGYLVYFVLALPFLKPMAVPERTGNNDE